MAIHFIWEESYEVGDEELDNQHKRIFKLANSLPETLDDERVRSSIMDIYRHARDHFFAEEIHMKEICYPGLDEHRKFHDGLIKKLSELGEQSFEDDESVLGFKKFVYDWIIEHIMVHDKDYFQFTQNI